MADASPGCFAIRLYGKRWLKLAKPDPDPHAKATSGWRPLVWCADIIDAEKWTRREDAEHFGLGLRSRFEIVNLAERSGTNLTIA